MEAPERIYLQLEGTEVFNKDTTWCKDKLNVFDVEYVRADIVKAQIEAAYNLGEKEGIESVINKVE